MPDRPKPPKPCPLCKVAMQLKAIPGGMVHCLRAVRTDDYGRAGDEKAGLPPVLEHARDGALALRIDPLLPPLVEAAALRLQNGALVGEPTRNRPVERLR